jgi:hypothetical protein
MQPTPEQREEVMRILGVSHNDLQACLRCPSFEIAVERLGELKARAKKNYKRAAFDLHPDRTGGDATKAALFTCLRAALTELEKIELKRRPPQPSIPTIMPGISINIIRGGAWGNTTTATNATTGTSTIHFGWTGAW